MTAREPHTLLQIAAAHDDLDRAGDAAAALVAHLGDADRLAHWLTTGAPQRLLPLLSTRWATLGLPDAVGRACERATSVAWGLNVRVLDEVGAVLDAWHRAGIDVLALKGIGLLGDVYPEHQLRPLGDADVLIPDHRLRDALDTMASLGWRVDRRHRWHLVGHGAAVNLGNGSGASIDVHRRLSRTLPVHDQRALWHDAEPLPVTHPLASSGIRRVGPVTHTVALIAHAARPDGTVHRLVDLHRHLVLRGELRTDDARASLVESLRRHHLAARARLVLDTLREHLGTPVPLHPAQLEQLATASEVEARLIAADRRASASRREATRVRRLADHVLVAAAGHGPAVRLQALGGTVLRATVARLD
ncbi:MAG: nucleotidyltransferase family protein [Ilumatobacteraceae bacterium]